PRHRAHHPPLLPARLPRPEPRPRHRPARARLRREVPRHRGQDARRRGPRPIGEIPRRGEERARAHDAPRLLRRPARLRPGADAVGPLAALARKWIGLGDDVSKALAQDAGLDEALLSDVATSASAEGKAASAKAAKAGSAARTDPPEVNTTEGRVVYELRAL